MKTIKEFKAVLRNEEKEENTMLGMHLNGLFNEDHDYDATVHNMDEKIEVIVEMFRNEIDVFNDTFKMGSVSKAYYKLKLSKYSNFK